MIRDNRIVFATCPLQGAAMRDSIVIRPYRKSDESAIVELVRELQGHELQLYDRMLPVDDIGPWYVQRILRESSDAGGGLIVAEQAGQPVGYATLFARLDSEEAYDEVAYTYAYIGDLVVSESARRQGVGTLLLRECETLARQAGQRWLRITVIASNGEAHRLYQALGFRNQFVNLEKSLA
jgi:ribosomal protein S18 acetylase RimI-like enzyme